MTYTCSVVPCKSYDNCEAALNKAIDDICGLDWVRPGMRVAIKANLVGAFPPEKAATTHPAFVSALVKRLAALGARPVVGDSPGGLYTPAALKAVYAATGMHEAEREGAELNLNCGYHNEKINGLKMHDLPFTDWLSDCDAVIDFCKLKSHGMMGMSGAVKNLYGVIPGLIKPQTHYLYPEVNDFADMLIDINEFVGPRLTLVDAVVGMEGNGPTAGDPREIGAVIAARTPYEADVACAALLGVDPAGVPTILAAERRGKCKKELASIALAGDIAPIALSDFKLVPRRSIRFLGDGRHPIVSGFIERCLTQRPLPVKKLCVGCGKCKRLCPAGAIEMEGRKKKTPRIDRSKCIRCFCCQEFCPKAAMKVRQTALMKAIQRNARE